jgi:hypothetical protein
MEHLTDKLDSWWFVWVLLFKVHDQAKCAILKGRVRGSDDDGVPSSMLSQIEQCRWVYPTYQVITLSATGEAETPAGGSVCIRYFTVSVLSTRAKLLFNCHTP